MYSIILSIKCKGINTMKKELTWNELLSTNRSRASSAKASKNDGRNAFEKDYHRIILSASFRRLQDKTQVFPLDQSDFVRTRLTHSLEVSSVARSLGSQVTNMLANSEYENIPNYQQSKEIGDLLSCAGLLHDIGNPPFGHYGETTIRNYYKTALERLTFKDKPLKSYLNKQMEEDLLNFEGNAQVLRLLSKLHYLKDEHGMNLTYGLLNTLIKYPVNSLLVNPDIDDVRYHKLGYFWAERDLFKAITTDTNTFIDNFDENDKIDNLLEDSSKVNESVKQLSFAPELRNSVAVRHPLTYLLEAADDISYRTADIEDASRKGKISYSDLKNYLTKSSRIGEYEENIIATYTKAVNKLDECLEDAKKNHEEKSSLYAIQNWLIYIQKILIESIGQTFVDNYQLIMSGYYKYDLFHNNLAGLILNVLGDLAYDYVFSSQSIVELEVAADAIITGLLDKFVPAAIHFDTEIEQNPVEKRLIALISDNYRLAYKREAEGKSEGEKLYRRLLLVNDYICGMTDSFARDLYYKFNGIY